MNKQELLNQIKEWGKAQQHQKIANAIEALPESERDYLFTCIPAKSDSRKVKSKHLSLSYFEIKKNYI